MSQKIRAAIVGCGGIAQVHAEALQSLDAVELIAAADIRFERAVALTERFGGKPYHSLEEMLDQEAVQVLHICTPHVLHTPMAQLAADRGIPVFTEKPPVITTKQWEQFRALQEKIPVGICFQNRYNPETQLLKDMLDSSAFGPVKGARAFITWRREAPYYTESGWRGALATEGGGVLINQTIHTMDLLVYLLGKPTGVEATMANHHLQGVIEVEDTFEARIDFSGIPALFYASSGYCTDAPVLLELCCENATVRMENGGLTVLWKDGRLEQHKPEPLKIPATGKAYWGAGHYVCIEDYYRCLAEGKTFRNSIPGVTDTIELMLAAYASARA